MLYTLVERICADIDTLPAATTGEPQFAQQIREAAADTVESLIKRNRERGNKKVTQDDAVEALTLLAFTFVRSIPRTARAMVGKLRDCQVHAARRCAIASVLAYLVQPHDIIPDDAPGYYGYLDDAIILHAGLVEYLDTLPEGVSSFSPNLVNLALCLAPEHARPALQSAVSSMSQLIQILNIMGPEIAEQTLAQIVANPLLPFTVTAPPGFSPHPARDYGGGHWSGGNSFEGNNVILGGVGSLLINGGPFIPG